MPPPPPFLLPQRRWSRVSALLAGAGRQRVAVAILALAAVLVAGFVWIRATPRLVGPGEGSATAAGPADPDAGAGDPSAGQGVNAGSAQALPRAAPDAVNLARKLTDGEQVLIPGPGDRPPLPPDAGAAPGTPTAPLDLNTATVEQLDTLPGVGEVTAGRIVAYRTAHPFTTVDELLEVPGIGQRRFEQLKDLVTVT